VTELGRLKSYLKAVTASILARTPAGRNLTVFPEDTFIVSYFRSGSTWSRFLFGNLIHEHEAVTFTNMQKLVPIIYNQPDRILRRLPRVLKSHECFDPRYPRVIYIVRDPRDVAVSFYLYNIKMRVIPEGYPMEKFVARWMGAKMVDYADRVGNWQDHVLSWIRLRLGKPGFALVRYEDLLRDPATMLANLAPFVGIVPTAERIARAIELSSVSHMQSLEKKQAQEWIITKGTRQDIPFVRTAKAGEWQEKLPPKAVKMIEDAWGATIKELGYDLARNSNAERELMEG
jgi:hypothetical protein